MNFNNKNSERIKFSSKSKTVILLIIGIISLIFFVSAVSAGKDSAVIEKAAIFRSDIINIDSMKFFGDIQEPEVVFSHDLHTEIMNGNVTDCLKCHQTADNKLVLKFMRTEDSTRQDVMNIYHNNCIACHEEAKDKNGPVVCRDCHTRKIKKISVRQSVGMDNSLHFRHTDSLENKCEKCHHEYDDKSKKLAYTKGKEGTCRYCHKKEKEENRVSFRDAAHNSCVNCHLEMTKKKKITGPVKCAGCHDSRQQALIKKVDSPQRIDRKQPDLVMIKTGNKDLDNNLTGRMDFVPFNHKGHETSNNTCRVCHHKELASCSSCHSVEGKKEGGFVNLESAMHNPSSEQSCTGCHEIKKQDAECMGCHALIGNTDRKDDAACNSCHVKLKAGYTGNEMLKERSSGAVSDYFAEVPEKIIIKKLEDKYKPAEFPHKKIIKTLVGNIKDNKLASSFHNREGLVCVGCHHNLPATKKPSGCATCHDASAKKMVTSKPGLMGAYHIQCMECHINMEIDKTGCTDCHVKK